MEIRLFKKGDTKQVAYLLRDSVKIPDIQGSTETQIQSWIPNQIHFRDWEELFLQTFTVVAETNSIIVGIAQLEDTGHINCFYCHEDYRREGIGGQLYAAIEDYAYSKGIPILYTETSSADRPFFFQMGFQKVQKQKVLIHGDIKSSYIIEKNLSE